MRSRPAIILLCCFLLITLAACSKTTGFGIDLPFTVSFHTATVQAAEQAVPLTSEPSHHLALENQYVRVFKVEVAPHATTLVHQHDRDYIYVVNGPAQVTNAVVGKAAVSVKLTDGEVNFAAGSFAHKATNDGAIPFRNVTIELLKPKKDDPAASAAARGIEAGHGVMIETVFIKDGVVAREITLNPGAMLPRHTHKTPHLVIAVSALDLRTDVEGQAAVEARMQPGDFRWVDAGVTHVVTNVGKAPARMVTLTFE